MSTHHIPPGSGWDGLGRTPFSTAGHALYIIQVDVGRQLPALLEECPYVTRHLAAVDWLTAASETMRETNDIQLIRQRFLRLEESQAVLS